MLGPWKDEEEMLECIMYWQKRALEAEKEIESTLDYERFLLDETLMYQERFYEMEEQRDYYKQMFLDKDSETREALTIVSQMYNKARHDLQSKEPEEEADDPWKYRS